MEINKTTIDKLKALNDDQLKEAIGQLADVLGANPKQKQMALNNVSAIRRKLSTATERDLQKQLNKITAEKQNEIAKKFKF